MMFDADLLAKILGINFNTVFSWIRQGLPAENGGRGGRGHKRTFKAIPVYQWLSSKRTRLQYAYRLTQNMDQLPLDQERSLRKHIDELNKPKPKPGADELDRVLAEIRCMYGQEAIEHLGDGNEQI